MHKILSSGCWDDSKHGAVRLLLDNTYLLYFLSGSPFASSIEGQKPELEWSITSTSRC
jgi:hypothetical protein